MKAFCVTVDVDVYVFWDGGFELMQSSPFLYMNLKVMESYGSHDTMVLPRKRMDTKP